MDISENRHGQYLLLAVSGQLNIATSAELDRCGKDLFERGERRIALDLSQLQYLSSAGIRSILMLERKLREAQGSLIVCAPSQPARMVLTLAGLLDKLSVVDSPADLPQ